jgi:hypothetical protein
MELMGMYSSCQALAAVAKYSVQFQSLDVTNLPQLEIETIERLEAEVSVVQFIIENSKFYDFILSQNLGSGSQQFFPTLCRNLYVRSTHTIVC